jgi:hypothetical protein
LIFEAHVFVVGLGRRFFKGAGTKVYNQEQGEQQT